MILFYVRHGRPTYVPDELTPLGKRQAESVAKRLAVYGIDRVFASSSNRAIETARPTSEICEREIEILDWCNEGHAWKYMSGETNDGRREWCCAIPEYRKLFLSPEVRSLDRDWFNHKAFSDTLMKEGVEFVRKNSDEFFASLGYVHNRDDNTWSTVRHNDDRIALFAHAGFGGLFLSEILDIPYPLFSTKFEFGYTGVTVIVFKPDTNGVVIPAVMTLSNDSHLYRDGVPAKYIKAVY